MSMLESIQGLGLKPQMSQAFRLHEQDLHTGQLVGMSRGTQSHRGSIVSAGDGALQRLT